ncbi:MAG: DUF3788 family protein [Bacteroidetes bacterium]|nr:DUF3788 family protein [Bacteroidota bacterium]
MERSVFTDKKHAPANEDIERALGALYGCWEGLIDFIKEQHPASLEEWNFSKFGWSCRIKDRKRAIIYLMPGEQQFRASFVLGAKATDEALASGIGEAIKAIISESPVYAEGRGVRILVEQKSMLKDLKKLVEIKLAN